MAKTERSGGSREAVLTSLAKQSGETVQIADGGKPYYDAQTAQRIAAMDIPCFACAPEKLPELLEQALTGRLR